MEETSCQKTTFSLTFDTYLISSIHTCTAIIIMDYEGPFIQIFIFLYSNILCICSWFIAICITTNIITICKYDLNTNSIYLVFYENYSFLIICTVDEFIKLQIPAWFPQSSSYLSIVSNSQFFLKEIYILYVCINVYIFISKNITFYTNPCIISSQLFQKLCLFFCHYHI